MLQYIGARYVPIFYENSLDPTSSEWEPNVTYEPMVWVSLPNGHMYISKKTVPANAGDPANTPEYWLEAGQYNAYIQTLQDQIDDMNDGTVTGSLQNQIDTMQDPNVSGSLQDQINDMQDGTVPGSLQDQINDMQDGSVPGSLQAQISSNDTDISAINGILRKLRRHSNSNVIAIGDSWGEGAYSMNGWQSYLPSYVTVENLYQSCQGGYGWTRSGLQFITLLQAVTVPDPNKIDLVIVAGGANDSVQQPSVTDVSNAMKAVADYVEATYPNAIIIGVGLSCHYGFDLYDQRVKEAGGLTNGYKGIFYYVDYTKVIPPTWFYSDGVHLANTAYYGYTGKLLSTIIEGVIDTNVTLSHDWAQTIYSTSLKNGNDDYISVRQRKVNGIREIDIMLHTSGGWDYFTFNQNLPAAAIKTYLNFTELVSGIDFIIPADELPFSFLARSTSAGTYFDITGVGTVDIRDVGQPNNALHIAFLVNVPMPYTIQRIGAMRHSYRVNW